MVSTQAITARAGVVMIGDHDGCARREERHLKRTYHVSESGWIRLISAIMGKCGADIHLVFESTRCTRKGISNLTGAT